MAVIIKNKKNFKVLRTSNVECLSWGGMAVCDSCNQRSSFGYFVAVLNLWKCPTCFKKWYESSKRYTEDIPFENGKYNTYTQMLRITSQERLQEG